MAAAAAAAAAAGWAVLPVLPKDSLTEPTVPTTRVSDKVRRYVIASRALTETGRHTGGDAYGHRNTRTHAHPLFQPLSLSLSLGLSLERTGDGWNAVAVTAVFGAACGGANEAGVTLACGCGGTWYCVAAGAAVEYTGCGAAVVAATGAGVVEAVAAFLMRIAWTSLSHGGVVSSSSRGSCAGAVCNAS